ncbi:uncharacterized protein LOC133933899 [Platichthys flesus]|uniref:uncharacterized protein LOC133933899 n=1 Tax=Platichthys flesus TaxID=8260 RepID=UPI002DBE80AE|nr:uncharacterized protein LOC133933899 [Platichthys flesus]
MPILGKQARKEILNQRHEWMLNENQLSTQDCHAVLVEAKDRFLACLDALSEEDPATLDSSDNQIVLYYLEAVLVLGHMQRPSVVENMTVSEWLSRFKELSPEKGHPRWVIAVKEHKTAATQLASFALSQEQEQWFDIYYRRSRPVFQRAGRKRKRGEDIEDVEDPKDLFFLSSTGKGVHRTTNDIARLQKKFNVPAVSSKVVRRVFETSTKDMSDSAKTLVAGYLTHSNAVTEQHYRYPTPGQPVKGIHILKGMA